MPVGTTDTIQFTCSACGHSAAFPQAQEGKAIYCPKCQAAQVVKDTGRFVAERIPTGRIAKAESAPATDRIARQPFGAPNRIDFTCSACNHSSRISATLAGQPVRCPTCGTVQLAGIGGLRVVRLDGAGKLPFTCTACAYQARLSADYAGKAIRCPKCQAAQVVPRLLRDPSGAQQALPPGTGVVRKEPGTGSVRKTPGTGPIAKPVSAALRTPAGGIPVATPMATPTPLPGSLEVAPPPPPRAPTADQLRTPQPMLAPEVSVSGPLVAHQTPPPVAPTPPPAPVQATPAPEPAVPADELFDADRPVTAPRGGVVRRSGRMGVARTPLPVVAEPPPVPPNLGAEPTLEPARAVDVVAEGHAAEAAPAAAPRRPLAAAASAAGKPWLLPVLGVVAILAVATVGVLAVMLSSANGRADGLDGKLSSERASLSRVRADLEEAKRSAEEISATKQLVEADRDAVRKDLASLRKDLEAARAEIEKLGKEKAERAERAEKAEKPKPTLPAGQPAVPHK